MKKILPCPFVLCLTLVLIGTVLAVNATEAASENRREVLRGDVVWVDIIGNFIRVKGKKAEETFQVDSKARIFISGREGKLADIVKGQGITVLYEVLGERKVAVEIR